MAATKKSQAGSNNPAFTHGMTHSPTHNTWMQLRRRCKERKRYLHLDVCERWANSFVNFLEDMGPKPEGMQIDRIDNTKGYFPENCRWATPKENCNNRRNTIYLSHDGITLPLSMWADKIGISPVTLRSRHHRGWSTERILGVA